MLRNLFFGSLCAAAALLTTPSAAEPAHRDPKLEKLFEPRHRGFLGADGAASVDLGNGRSLWIFGDTVIGNLRNGKREGPMVRNSIAIVEGYPDDPKSSFYWDLTDGIPGEFFRPDSWEDPNWYWPGCGIAIDGKVYLFLSRMAKGEGEAGFAFQTVGSSLFRIHNPDDNPREWKMTRTDIGVGNDHFNINAACWRIGDTVYLLGYDDGPAKLPMQRASILGRISVAALTGAEPAAGIEYLSNGDTWGASTQNLKPMFRPGPTETAVHVDPFGQHYALTLTPFQPEILLFTASAPEGPWIGPRTVYTIPEVKEREVIHAYTTRFHPMFSTEKELSFTYVTNSKDFWSMFAMSDIYYPRFMRLPISELTAKESTP